MFFGLHNQLSRWNTSQAFSKNIWEFIIQTFKMLYKPWTPQWNSALKFLHCTDSHSLLYTKTTLICIPRYFTVHFCLPITLWTSLLDLLAFGSPFAAHTVDAIRSSNSLRLQALRWLLVGKLNRLTLLQAAEAIHVQLALEDDIGRGFHVKITVWSLGNSSFNLT